MAFEVLQLGEREPERVRAALARREPFVVKGLVDDWPALRKWTPDYFRARIPDVSVVVETWSSPTNDPRTFLNRTAMAKKMLLKEYVDLLQSTLEPSKANYIAQFPLFEVAPEIARDAGDLDKCMSIPSWVPSRLRGRLRMPVLFWFGPAGTVTTLHFDVFENFFVQVRGRKQFLLVSPGQSKLVYFPERDFRFDQLHFSPVDAEAPDLQRYPLFRTARPLEVVVEAGDVLHIPSGWWHYVRGLEPSISLNYWWVDGNALVQSAPFLLRRTAKQMRARLGSLL